MPITRRAFLQSTTSTAVCLAAENVGNCSWLFHRSDRLRIGILGLGSSGFEHMTVYSALAGAQIVALCDPDQGRLRTAAKFLRDRGQSPAFLSQSLARLLDDPSIDAISIAGSPPNHFDLVRRVTEARKPLLFDAPTVDSWEEALRVRRLAETSGVTLRNRLHDHLQPDTNVLRTSVALRSSIGQPVGSSLHTRLMRNSPITPIIPAMACLDLLLEASEQLDEKRADSLLPSWTRPEVTAGVGNTLIAFPTSASFLKKVQVHSLGPPLSPPALLELHGTRGRLGCESSWYPIEASSAHTFVEFLAAIRNRSSDKNERAQRGYIAAGLIHLIQSAASSR